MIAINKFANIINGALLWSMILFRESINSGQETITSRKNIDCFIYWKLFILC